MSRIILDHGTLGRIEYPNALHYAYDSAIVAFPSLPAGVTAVQLAITFNGTGRTFTERRERYGESVTFDIARYLQMAFAGVDFTRTITNNEYNFQLSPTYIPDITIEAAPIVSGVNWDGIYSWSASIELMWGSLRLGEVGFGSAPRKWWKGYPFTLDFNVASLTSIRAEVAGEQIGAVVAPYYGTFLVDMNKTFPSLLGNVVLSAECSQVLNDTESTALTAYNIEVCDCGVELDTKRYLRWIDNQGRYCYWLFNVLGTSVETASSQWIDSTLRRSNAFPMGVNENQRTRQSFTTSASVQLITPNLTERYYPLLLSLASSPVVEVFDGYDSGDTTSPLWHRVNIVAGTYEKMTKNHCEDFGVTIAEAVHNTQMQ